MGSKCLYAPHKIRPGYGEFRVLCIDPANDRNAPLQGHLRVVALRDHPKYSTLSYCWGNQKEKVRLELDCYGLDISTSLDQALRSFRALKQSVIWVDQICINQNDVHERNEQIMMMKDIYATSSKCYVHLGVGAEDPQHLAELVDYIKSHRGDSGWIGRLRQYKGDFISAQRDDPVAGWRRWRRCLFDMISQPYFSRIWVLQEIFFSQKIKCLWGSSEFDWDIIESCAKDLPVRESLSATPAFKRMPAFTSWNTGVVEEVDQKTALDDNRRAVALDQFSSFIELMDSLKETQSRTMSSLLVASRGFKSTDPRDKIFALLSMAIDSDCFPRPDYRWTLEKVYRRVARSLIRQGRDATVLSLAGIQVSPLFESSWVPDWRNVSLFWDFQRRSTFCAGGELRDHFVESQSRSLIVPANEFDSVKMVCPFISDRPGLTWKITKFIEDATGPILAAQIDGLKQPWSVENTLVSLIFCDNKGNMEDDGLRTNSDDFDVRHMLEIFSESTSLMERHPMLKFLDAMQAMQKAREQFLGDEHFKDFEILRAFMDDYFHLQGLQVRVREDTIRALRERGIDYIKYLNTIDRSTRAIITRDGRLGLAPSASEVGDIIAIIQGARAPFILRNQGCARHFKVVGQGYIRGIMFGEAREKTGFAFQEIEIC